MKDLNLHQTAVTGIIEDLRSVFPRKPLDECHEPYQMYLPVLIETLWVSTQIDYPNLDLFLRALSEIQRIVATRNQDFRDKGTFAKIVDLLATVKEYEKHTNENRIDRFFPREKEKNESKNQ